MTVVSTANADANLPSPTDIADDLIGTGTPPAAGQVVQWVKIDEGAPGISDPMANTDDVFATGVADSGIISLLKGIYSNTLGSVDGGFASSVATGGIDGGFA